MFGFVKELTLLFPISLFMLDLVLAVQRPAYFPTCYRNDPEINKCMLKATEEVKQYLAKGVPEIKLPPIEPLFIPQLKLEQGSQALNFKAILENIKAHGLSNYKFSRFDFDVPTLQFFCQAHIGKFTMDGDYSVTGRILIAPIEGKGRFKAEIDSSEVLVQQKYKTSKLSDGKIHLVPIFTNTSIKVLKPRAHLDGLFNGNEALNEATNKAINDNVDELFEDLKPVVEETMSRVVENLVLKTITNSVAYDDLYPLSPKWPSSPN